MSDGAHRGTTGSVNSQVFRKGCACSGTENPQQLNHNHWIFIPFPEKVAHVKVLLETIFFIPRSPQIQGFTWNLGCQVPCQGPEPGFETIEGLDAYVNVRAESSGSSGPPGRTGCLTNCLGLWPCWETLHVSLCE